MDPRDQGYPDHQFDAGMLEEAWEDSHPCCESCHKRGCPHGCCDMEGLVMLTDGLIYHPLCLAREQAADAAFGNVEYRVAGPR